MASVELWLRISDAWQPILSIPISECNRFALKPLKWLRFLGYTIYGREGDISLARNGLPVDYERGVEGGARYYFISSESPQIVDVDFIDDRTTSSQVTESRADFRDAVFQRDGTCILTNSEASFCQACHYCPHSKGSDFLRRAVGIRGGGSDITSINDVRNGLVLTPALHFAFGRGQAAFLKTPNFAMSDNDVHPSGRVRGSQNNPAGRFIFQFFKPPSDDTLFTLVPHNQDARLPINMDKFPPPVIVDMFYGCAAVLKWRTDHVSNAIKSRSLYYDDTDSGGNSSGQNIKNDVKLGGSKENKQQVNERAARAKARGDRYYSEASPLADAMDFVANLWLIHAPEHRERSPPEQAQAQEQEGSRNKVSNWLQTQ